MLAFSNVRQLGQELVELLLAFIELSTSDKVNPEKGHDAVNDQQAVLVGHEELGDLVEKFQLMFRIDGASIGDVLLGYAGLVCHVIM